MRTWLCTFGFARQNRSFDIPIVQGIIVLDLEQREGSRFVLPSCSIRSLVTPKKILSSTRWGGGGIFGPRPFLLSTEMFRMIKVSTSVHT